MRKFYLIFRNKKVAPLVPHLNWSHCLLLIPLNDIDVVFYYAYQIVNRNLSKRQLHEAILSHEYERLPDHTKLELLSGNPNKRAEDYIKEPNVIRNSNNYESLSEKVLQQIILENIPSFLEELGEGFTFIRNEYRIRMGDYYNYIDLLLFNYIYNCFVVIELKVTELKKEHIGQISTYMNYIDRNIKCIYHDKTIGIIICKKNHKYIMEYCSDSRIHAREFLIIHDV